MLNKYIHRCQIHWYIFQFNIHWFCYHCSKSYRKICAHPPIHNHVNTHKMKREKGKPVSTMWWPIENHSHLQVCLWFCYLKAFKRDIIKFDLTPYDSYKFDDNTQKERNYHKPLAKSDYQFRMLSMKSPNPHWQQWSVSQRKKISMRKLDKKQK